MTHDPQQAGRGAGKTSFGFREVPASERQGLVNDVFARVARNYDLMNDLMSGGLHRLWKDDFVAALNPPRSAQPFRLLDAAGGTGDIALRVLDLAGGGCEVVIADISREMLEAGRRKIGAAGHGDRIRLVEANAEALPFAGKSFDAYTVAFGIRNMTDIGKVLAEAHRVLKIGGRFLCLEFSECQVPILDRLYDFHSFQVIPRLGRLAAGAEEPYQYLVESIRRFPNQERFAAMIWEAGFARVAYRNLSGGIAAIHSGWRI
jgi:demethylmenaquinone methyltransferase/2-methoxy-6-polyprenyl-1,4-benzoquinol methylase